MTSSAFNFKSCITHFMDHPNQPKQTTTYHMNTESQVLDTIKSINNRNICEDVTDYVIEFQSVDGWKVVLNGNYNPFALWALTLSKDEIEIKMSPSLLIKKYRGKRINDVVGVPSHLVLFCKDLLNQIGYKIDNKRLMCDNDIMYI
jgi:hypothetical protein